MGALIRFAVYFNFLGALLAILYPPRKQMYPEHTFDQTNLQDRQGFHDLCSLRMRRASVVGDRLTEASPHYSPS